MRLIGSFQTITSQGRSGVTSSSSDGRSTSTGAVVGAAMPTGSMMSEEGAPASRSIHGCVGDIGSVLPSPGGDVCATIDDGRGVDVMRGLASTVRTMALRTPENRERSADMWRALAICLVVLG